MSDGVRVELLQLLAVVRLFLFGLLDDYIAQKILTAGSPFNL
jgi:hypothetical protein